MEEGICSSTFHNTLLSVEMVTVVLSDSNKLEELTRPPKAVLVLSEEREMVWRENKVRGTSWGKERDRGR